MKSDDGITLRISSGNTKIGKTPNLSLPPVTTCRTDALCFADCYAAKFYRIYPNVRAAWDFNLHLYKTNPDQFFSELAIYLTMKTPERFRLHVSGDFPDVEYFSRIADVFSAYPNTSVLAFTKRFDYPLDEAPRNMKIVLSAWPGMDLPSNIDRYPVAWLDSDPRRPVGTPYISCPGSCVECEFACWHGVSAELPVVFKKH